MQASLQSMNRSRMAEPRKPRNSIVHDILTEVAETRSIDLFDLPPIGETIDTDALQSLLESSEGVHIVFEYDGYEVAVSNENISVHGIND